jgi:hypothetical protein
MLVGKAADLLLTANAVMCAVAAVRCDDQRPGLRARQPDVWAAEELLAARGAEPGTAEGECWSSRGDWSSDWQGLGQGHEQLTDTQLCSMQNLDARAACLHDAMLPSARMTLLVPMQVQSNGVLDQLVRKWTTDIDQCRGDQVCFL